MVRSDANKRLRVFFALAPDAATQEALGIVAREIAARGSGRAIVDANLHLTLAFIGDADSERVETLRTILATLPRKAFTLALDCIGAFRHSDLAWIAPSEVPSELTTLQCALASALVDAGFALETRPFHAHVTLARRCAKKVTKARTERLVWRVEHVALLASIAGNGGVTYRELAGIRLD